MKIENASCILKSLIGHPYRDEKYHAFLDLFKIKLKKHQIFSSSFLAKGITHGGGKIHQVLNEPLVPNFWANVPQDRNFWASVPQAPSFWANVPQAPNFWANVFQAPNFWANVHPDLNFWENADIK